MMAEMEIDPDVRLAARLTFGRRWWRLAVQATRPCAVRMTQLYASP